MKTQFRCANSRPEEWHFEKQCPNWPAADFIEIKKVPPTLRLCPKCVDLKARALLSNMLAPRDSTQPMQ
ncbi:MAG TPA: hypothetical protein VGH50_03520 [Candidatus Binatia bacterium]|jgi:hypothetical protein